MCIRDRRGTALIADDIGSTQPSTFPAPDVQLMVYTSTNGQPITNTNCARLLIATDAKQTGPQGYNGALDFGNSDASASTGSNEYNYRLASIMSNAGGDTSSTIADGNLEFYTKQSSGSLAMRITITDAGHFVPASTGTYDIGTSSLRRRNIYTNDLNLSNEGSKNDVDGTWGSYTIQECEDDLFLINKRSGKKYKFNLTEVS